MIFNNDITIYLKDKIDEKAFGNILVGEGLTKISIEIQNSGKSNIYHLFKFGDKVDLTNITYYYNMIGLDTENSCIYITKIFSFKEVSKSTLVKPASALANSYMFNNAITKSNNVIKDILNNVIKDIKDISEEKDFIESAKEILFKEKILDEVYDKSKEYKKNIEKYEANTDDIIEKIEEKEKTEPYDLFIIKHFIKYVIDKYKEENISSEDNSANENNEDNKNITTNPFITNGE